ncbi:MAG TPA: phospholipase D-like domain-containing protein [Rhodopila sp.]|nr:phospholipase D-like domain-containing protein [Rhodopila sp.]
MLGALAEWLAALGGIIPERVLAAIDLAIAIAVTWHVLLTKRDVGAATGWIGLAWISPIVGGSLYFVFGVNRVARRGAQIRDQRRYTALIDADPPSVDRDDHLAPLEKAVRLLTDRPSLVGNCVELLQNGDAAYPRMLAAIAAAERSVALSTYILRDDAAGGPIIDALIAAQARGCQVRVLIDGIGGGWFGSRAYKRLRRARVPVARFMHSLWPWRMPFLNLRTHKKVLVVDGARGFAGGMNIGAENLVATGPRHPVRDSHFAFDGPAVAQLADAFACDWEFVVGETLEGDLWFPGLVEAGEAVARVVTSGPDQDLEKIEFVTMHAIACARRSVQVVTPYFLPDERLVTTLTLAAQRGVAVDVLVPERSNHRVVDWAMRANVAPLLRAGVRIWRNPPPFDHSKVMVVDGEWCLIGSANWDARSLRLNFELNVEVYHDDLADRLSALIARNRAHPFTLAELDRRILPTRLLDAGLRLLLPYL